MAMRLIVAFVVLGLAAPSIVVKAQGARAAAPSASAPVAGKSIPERHNRCKKFIDEHLAWIQERLKLPIKLPFTRQALALQYSAQASKDWGVPTLGAATAMAEKAQQEVKQLDAELTKAKVDLAAFKTDAVKYPYSPLLHSDQQQAIDASEATLITLKSAIQLNTAKLNFARCALANMKPE